MKILYIAPLPPPINGQSLVSEVFLEELSKKYEVKVVNTSKILTSEKFYLFKRIGEVIKLISKIWRLRKGNSHIYVTISESFAGNIKDIITYLCLINHLSKIIIHVHGGSLKKELWSKHPILFYINRIFIKRFEAIIISGLAHINIFENLIDLNKIHIIPNFAPNQLFILEEEFDEKFKNIFPLRILYISGLRERKGYLDLFNSFNLLPDELKNQIRIDFAGAFISDLEKTSFLNKISGIEQIQYHGIIDNTKKTEFFINAHIFCLPTNYFEGQPISIIEAYASGCVVITTNLGGTKDIFIDNLNGYQIESNNPTSISSQIESCISLPEKLKNIASFNRKLALEKFRSETFTSTMIALFEKLSTK